jgi:hypothetical protein
MVINQRITQLFKSTPFSLMLGRSNHFLQDSSDCESDLISPEYLEKRWNEIHKVLYPTLADVKRSKDDKLVEQFNKTYAFKKEEPFPTGSYVMLTNESKANKWEQIYEGPYKVVRRNTGGAYVLQDNTGALLPRNTSANKLKLISRDEIPNTQIKEIESIIDHRKSTKIEGSMEYMVKWKHIDADFNSWVPVHDFDDYSGIQQYWKRRGKQTPIVPSKKLMKASGVVLKSVIKSRDEPVPTRKSARLAVSHLEGSNVKSGSKPMLSDETARSAR